MNNHIQQKGGFFLAFSVAVLAALMISSPGISIAISLYLPFSSEEINFVLRILQVLFSLVLIIYLTFKNSYSFKYRLSYILVLFYSLYVISCIRHELIHGFVELDPLRFWFVVGPLVLCSFIVAIFVEKFGKFDVGVILSYMFFLFGGIMVSYMVVNGINNIRNYTVYTDDIGGSLVFGYFAAYGIAVASGVLFSDSLGERGRILFFLGMPLLAYILLISYSRGSVVACAAAFLYVMFIRYIRRGGAVNYFYFAFGLVSFLAIAVWYAGSDWGSRVTGTTDRISSGQEARVDIWLTIFQLAKGSVFGWGVEVPYLNHPHNIIVEIFMNMGIFGVFLFLVLIFYCLRGIVTNPFLLKNPWIGSIFCAAFVGSLFSSTLYLNVVVWFAMALVTRVDRTPVGRSGAAPRHAATVRGLAS